LDIGASVGEAAFNFANNFVNPCDNRFISNALEETGQGFFQGFIGGAIQNTFGGNPCGRR